MKKVVISLGGSVIVPDKVDYNYLLKFKGIISNFCKRNKLVIITGGGSTARKYMNLKHFDAKTKSLIGISSTKLNARLVAGIFGKKLDIPEKLSEVRKDLRKSNLVICGALGMKANSTTDGNAAEIAKFIKADYFINITNIKGLYDKNPGKFKNAKFIPNISFKDFLNIVNKIKFKAGQHFILDQFAAKLISKKKIRTFIVGPNLSNLKKVLLNKKFVGTIIS
jgi:uridylate kinase